MIKTGQAARTRRPYRGLMTRPDLRPRAQECPSCGRTVLLNRSGCYRRHFATQPDGRLRLCAGSRAHAGVLPRAASHELGAGQP